MIASAAVCTASGATSDTSMMLEAKSAKMMTAPVGCDRDNLTARDEPGI